MKRIIKGVLAAALVATALTAGTISFAANTEVSAIEGVTATLTGSLDDSNFAYYGVGKTNKNIESTTANISSDGEYVISWTVSGNASTVDYLYLDLNFPSPINTQPIKDTFPDLNIVVTEVKTGSTIVDYKMGTNSVNYDYLNGGLDSVRVTLCDQSTANNGYQTGSHKAPNRIARNRVAAAGKLNGHTFGAVNRYGHTTCRRSFFLRQAGDTRNQNGSKEFAEPYVL